MVKICLAQPNIDINIPLVLTDLKKTYWPVKGRDEVYTTLYLAVLIHNIDIIQLLLNHPRIDINMKSTIYENKYDDSESIKTPLHAAVINKKIDIIQLLLQQKAIDINALDEKNKKPIDYTDDQTIKKLFINLQK